MDADEGLHVKYDAVVFDFDGTLADSFVVFMECWTIAAHRHGFQPPEDHDVESLRGLSARQIVAQVGLAWWKLPFVGKTMRRLMQERADRITVFDGIESLIGDLKAHGLVVGIVTSSGHQSVRRVLSPALAAQVDHMACGASLFGKQSKTRALLRAARVRAERVLSVGDEIRDADVARAMGMDFAGVAWGYTRAKELGAQPSVQLCHTPADLRRLLLPTP